MFTAWGFAWFRVFLKVRRAKGLFIMYPRRPRCERGCELRGALGDYTGVVQVWDLSAGLRCALSCEIMVSM